MDKLPILGMEIGIVESYTADFNLNCRVENNQVNFTDLQFEIDYNGAVTGSFTADHYTDLSKVGYNYVFIKDYTNQLLTGTFYITSVSNQNPETGLWNYNFEDFVTHKLESETYTVSLNKSKKDVINELLKSIQVNIINGDLINNKLGTQTFNAIFDGDRIGDVVKGILSSHTDNLTFKIVNNSIQFIEGFPRSNFSIMDKGITSMSSSFDISGIVTGIIKRPEFDLFGSGVFVGSEELVGVDLTKYFLVLNKVLGQTVDIDQTSTGMDVNGHDKIGQSGDGRFVLGIGHGDGCYGSYSTIYKRIYENFCPRCGRSGTIGLHDICTKGSYGCGDETELSCMLSLGGCFEQNEKMFVKQDNNYFYIKIEDLHKRFQNGEKFETLSVKKGTDHYEWKKILNTWDNGFKECTKLVLPHNKSIIVSNDHKFPTISFKESKKYRLTNNELKTHELKKSTVLGTTKYNNQYLETDNIIIDPFYKLLGFILGDGTSDGNRVRIELKKDDKKDYIENILKECDINYTVTNRIDRENTTSFSINSKNDRFNEIMNASKFRKIDDINENTAAGLLSGLLSSDGYVREPKNFKNSKGGFDFPRVIFSTTNENILDIILACCFLLNIDTKFKKETNHGGLGKKPIYRVTLTCSNRVLLFKKLNLRSKQHEHFINFESEELTRKTKNIITASKVKEFIDVGEKHVYNFEVEDFHIIASAGLDRLITSNCGADFYPVSGKEKEDYCSCGSIHCNLTPASGEPQLSSTTEMWDLISGKYDVDDSTSSTSSDNKPQYTESSYAENNAELVAEMIMTVGEGIIKLPEVELEIPYIEPQIQVGSWIPYILPKTWLHENINSIYASVNQYYPVDQKNQFSPGYFFVSKISYSLSDTLTTRITLNPIPPEDSHVAKLFYEAVQKYTREKKKRDKAAKQKVQEGQLDYNTLKSIEDIVRTGCTWIHPWNGGSVDCWECSKRLYKALTNIGIKCEVRQYRSSPDVSNHRSVLIDRGSGWVRFPYRQSQNGICSFDTLLNDTDNVWNGFVVANGGN